MIARLESAAPLAEVAPLAARFQGPVFRPGDGGYDAERAGFQTAIGQQPAVIAAAASAADVRAAVEFAAAGGRPVSVQATGHGLANPAPGGVLISTRRMTGVRVDARARTAWLAAGTRWEEVIRETARHGLAPLSGSAPDVGVVGYTLGGGLGLLSRQYGYAADHVHSIDVVTADARLRHVTADTDSDLFWALRGGRNSFGVVTGMEIGLLPVTRIYGGGLFFDAGLAPEILRAYRDWTASLPEDLTSSVSLITYPDARVVTRSLRGRRVVHFRMAYTGTAETGDRLVAPLRAVGPRLIDSLREMPYSACGSIYNDPRQPHGYYGTSVMLRTLDDLALAAMLELDPPGAPVPCIADLRHLGGALGRPPAVANAVGQRDARYVLRLLTPLATGDASGARPVHQRVFDTLAPWATGRSLNFTYGEGATADQVRTFYDPADYERLTEVKARYDPSLLFRAFPGIPPATGPPAQ
jgi:hypothetical protein